MQVKVIPTVLLYLIGAASLPVGAPIYSKNITAPANFSLPTPTGNQHGNSSIQTSEKSIGDALACFFSIGFDQSACDKWSWTIDLGRKRSISNTRSDVSSKDIRHGATDAGATVGKRGAKAWAKCIFSFLYATDACREAFRDRRVWLSKQHGYYV